MATRTNNLKELTKRRDNVKKSVSQLHDNVLKNTDDLVSTSIQTGKKWQKLMDKAVKNSEPLMNKQVDLVFDTIETVKEQMVNNRKRMSKLFGIDAKEIKKATRKAANKARATVKEVAENPKKAVEKTVERIAEAVDITDYNEDLKVIDGIGPKMEQVLNNAGINNYKDLAGTTVPKLRKILLEADNRYRLMDPAPWKAEAAKLK